MLSGPFVLVVKKNGSTRVGRSRVGGLRLYLHEG